MGFLDRLFARLSGREQHHGSQQGQWDYGRQPSGQGAGPGGFGQQPSGQAPDQPSYGRGGPQDAPTAGQGVDDQAIRRYQYLLATAPPAQIERAHEEAFAKLTPQQRQELLARLAQGDPLDRPTDDSPRSLARSATRTEMRRPGTLPQMLGSGAGRMGGGMGMGTILLSSVAGAFIGTAIAHEFFDQDGFMDWDTSGGDAVADGGGAAFAEDAALDTGQVEGASFDQGLSDGGGFGGSDVGGFDGGGFDAGGFDF